jgi:hypothetical protein
LLAELLEGSHLSIVPNRRFTRRDCILREAFRLRCSPYRSGRALHWIKVKNPKAPHREVRLRRIEAAKKEGPVAGANYKNLSNDLNLTVLLLTAPLTAAALLTALAGLLVRLLTLLVVLLTALLLTALSALLVLLIGHHLLLGV